MTVSNIYAVILAGGSGTRLWPLSRELHPKQLMTIEDNYTLFQAAFIRLVNCMDDKNILSVTNVKLESQVNAQLDELQHKFCRSSSYRVITEPQSRGTAGAIALSVKYIEKLHEDRKGLDEPIIVVVPSDNLISGNDEFCATIQEAIKLAKENYIVTLGVKPTRPDTGLGYLLVKKNKKIKDIAETGMKVDTFVEKPKLEHAQDFVESEKYYWNSGVYVFKASVLMNELKKCEPEIFRVMKNAQISSQAPSIPFLDYEEVPEISIDYAVMENTKKLAMVPLKCEWNDVGSWEAVYEISEKDKKGNYFNGNVYDVDSENSVVYSSSKLITTLGLKDTVVVETEDAILVCDRNRAQEVKHLVQGLKSEDNKTVVASNTVYRPWGYYTVLSEGNGFLTKCIYVNPGAKLSIQLHHHRKEHWVVLEGKAFVLKGENYLELEKEQSIDIDVEEKHSLQNPYDEPLKILEVQQGEVLDENDIERFEDMYGRV